MPLNLKSKTQNPKSVLSEAGSFLDLDRVALHLVVERGPLDAEEFGSFLLVAVTFCKRLKNRVSLDVIETLHAYSSAVAGPALSFEALLAVELRWAAPLHQSILVAPAPPHIQSRFAIRRTFPGQE